MTSRSLTKEIIIKRSEARFGKNRFDYSQLTYINKRTKIKLICALDQTPFEVLVQSHFKANKDTGGCPTCLEKWRKEVFPKLVSDKTTKWTKEKIFEEAKKPFFNISWVKIVFTIIGSFSLILSKGTVCSPSTTISSFKSKNILVKSKLNIIFPVQILFICSESIILKFTIRAEVWRGFWNILFTKSLQYNLLKKVNSWKYENNLIPEV